MWQKKRVWQVTTIIQLALCHLVTSHFQEIACNYTPKGQIRWPIFLLLLCMIVLTEITSKFPKPIIFQILVFSCHKMTLITIITRMPQVLSALGGGGGNRGAALGTLHCAPYTQHALRPIHPTCIAPIHPGVYIQRKTNIFTGYFS